MKEGVKSKINETTGKAKDEAEGAWDKVESRIEEAVGAAFQKAGVPSRDEIATLTKRVDESSFNPRWGSWPAVVWLFGFGFSSLLGNTRAQRRRDHGQPTRHDGAGDELHPGS